MELHRPQTRPEFHLVVTWLVLLALLHPWVRSRPPAPQHALLGIFVEALPVKLWTAIVSMNVTTPAALLGNGTVRVNF